MSAQKGNQFWKLRSKHGRDKLFETPELLLESAFEYFQWCDDNPIIKTESTKTDKGYIEKEIPTPRPYTRDAFFLYIGCSDNWLREFKKTCNDDFLRVIADIEKTIDTNQLIGATVGMYNANIIARIQGLKEQTESVNINHNKNETELSPEQIKEIADKLRNDY
jgi:hypothetical protein